MRFAILPFVLVATFAVSVLHAQSYEAEKPLGSNSQQTPNYLAHAGIEQRLGQPLPLNATFTDETGRAAPLSAWFNDFKGKPVVIAEVYYKCAMLCPQVLHGLATGLGQTSMRPGTDYQVLVFSIDPTDKPADAIGEKQTFLSQAGWSANALNASAVHFLTGDTAAISAMSGSTGFHYVRVPGPDGKLDQFAHSSVIMFATPEGKLSRYLSGIDYPARDLRMALLDASQKRISNPVDLLILYCCNYSPVVGRYSVSVLRILSLAGFITLIIVIAMIYLLTRKPTTQHA